MNRYREGDGSKITPFKRYAALVWFDLTIMQPVPYILREFLVDGDLRAAANNGMESSGWLRREDKQYHFFLSKMLGLIIPFPMICALKVDHGIQTGENALGYDTQGCNSCHSGESSFWKFLGYPKPRLRQLQQPR